MGAKAVPSAFNGIYAGVLHYEDLKHKILRSKNRAT